MTTDRYRLLEPYETIQEGDEWCSYHYRCKDGYKSIVDWTVEQMDFGLSVGSIASRVIRQGTVVLFRRKLAQPDFRWIPVAERLPDSLSNVFAPVLVKGWCRPGFGLYSSLIGCFDLTFDNCLPSQREGAVVTHWMELPPAPKPGPTHEDRQVEAFRKSVEHCKPSIVDELIDGFRKALAVT